MIFCKKFLYRIGHWLLGYADDLSRQKACGHCIMSGHIKCFPGSQRLEQLNLPDDPLAMELLNLQPSDTRVNTPPPRTKEDWISYLEDSLAHNANKRTCSRHINGELVHIAPNTLDGEREIRRSLWMRIHLKLRNQL